MDDLDEAKLKAELDGIGRTIDGIIRRVRAFEAEVHQESGEEDRQDQTEED